jgi:hypothetical protein
MDHQLPLAMVCRVLGAPRSTIYARRWSTVPEPAYHGDWRYNSLVVGQREFKTTCFAPTPNLVTSQTVGDAVSASRSPMARPGRRRQELLAEGDEAGADGLAGDLVEEAAGVQVDGAEDGPASVGAGRHDLLAAAFGDPGGPHPRQQASWADPPSLAEAASCRNDALRSTSPYQASLVSSSMDR